MKIIMMNDPEKRACFRCPGCGHLHQVPTAGPNAWGYNNDVNMPTFEPSILVTSGHYVDPERYEINHPASWRCHSFVTSGIIQFLNDCTHNLAGQMVQLNEVECEQDLYKK